MRDACPQCRGRGARVIAVITDPHYVTGDTGRPEIRVTYSLPVVAPCACTSERAAREIKP
jgi:hypothetical protein